MEIVIVLVIFAGIAYYLFSKRSEVDAPSTVESAPYKVPEPVTVSVTPLPMVVETHEPVEQPAPKAASAKAKVPAAAKKPTAPKKSPAPKKVETKKPAAITTAPKAKKPRAPKAK